MNKKKSVIKNNRVIILFCMASLILIMIIANSFAVSALGNGFNIRTSREFVDQFETGASGKADIYSITTKSGLNNVQIRINLKNLDTACDCIKKCSKCKPAYEAYLYDQESDFVLSLGAFNVGKSGKAVYTFQQKQINFLIYDGIVIMKRPMNSEYPISGMPVLIADITGSLNID